MNKVRLHVWGDFACFTRPETGGERYTYDVITPSAARGVLDSIYHKPAFKWRVDRIHVLKPVKTMTLKRNEIANKISFTKAKGGMKRNSLEGLFYDPTKGSNRQQRSVVLLRDVEYVIEASFILQEYGLTENRIIRLCNKHREIFKRRASTGACFRQPYFGIREFAANFEFLDENAPLPESKLNEWQKNQDFNLMFHDFNYKRKKSEPPEPHFFRAKMVNGVIDVPPFFGM